MQVAIACRHGSISADVQQYMTDKSQKLLTLFERITAIQVTVEFVDHRVRVEILVDAEHKHNFVAHDEGGEGEEATVSFDRTLHKMEQQIRKYKEKVQDHHRGRQPEEPVDD
ncbi:MAG: ribosome-associated translation inhibitor RaiA [Planctomycetota bacterium]|nr:ribosome-associated translation inhibitor RaiA [Planctomycetota bacterium]MDA1212938.1 ribosome-associated translation inhibitor RaiA [Planctomycetota bacterium]